MGGTRIAIAICMSIVKASLCAGLCVAALACRNNPDGSHGSDQARPVEGTGHTGQVAPARGTSGDPEVSPNAPSASASTTANPPPAVPPSGTGNSNSDVGTTMGSPPGAGSSAMVDAGVGDAGARGSAEPKPR